MIYLYRHPETGKIIEVSQKMAEPHIYIKDGIKYDRVFINPQVAFNINIDPFSKNQWMDKTHRKGTVGEMQDLSAELSEKRARKCGEDPFKRKLFDDYKKKTGKLHPEAAPKKIETKDFIVEL